MISLMKNKTQLCVGLPRQPSNLETSSSVVVCFPKLATPVLALILKVVMIKPTANIYLVPASILSVKIHKKF